MRSLSNDLQRRAGPTSATSSRCLQATPRSKPVWCHCRNDTIFHNRATARILRHNDRRGLLPLSLRAWRMISSSRVTSDALNRALSAQGTLPRRPSAFIGTPRASSSDRHVVSMLRIACLHPSPFLAVPPLLSQRPVALPSDVTTLDALLAIRARLTPHSALEDEVNTRLA